MPILTMFAILFAVCLVVFSIGTLVFRLEIHWARLPHFYCARSGVVHILCSVFDFEEALKAGHLIERPGEEPLVVVRDAVVMSEDNRPNTIPLKRFGRRYADRSSKGVRGSIVEKTDLFVPFVSERYMTYADQKALFPPPVVDVKAFADTKFAENCRRSFKQRFCRWVEDHDPAIGRAQLCAVFAMIFSVLAIVVLSGIRTAEAHQNERHTIYLTTPGQPDLQEITVSNQDADRMPVIEMLSGRQPIYKGRIQEIQSLGGGVALVCIPKHDNLSCGFADSSLKLKKGDVAYLRTDSVLLQRDARKNFHEEHRSTGSWVISEQEALALRDKAGYRIVDSGK
jgi:hypothetical protein